MGKGFERNRGKFMPWRGRFVSLTGLCYAHLKPT